MQVFALDLCTVLWAAQTRASCVSPLALSCRGRDPLTTARVEDLVAIAYQGLVAPYKGLAASLVFASLGLPELLCWFVAVCAMARTASADASDTSPEIHEQFTPHEKQMILGQYRSYSHDSGYQRLAERFCVNGGRKTIERWAHRYDGTLDSLERKQGSGGHSLLNPQDVVKYVDEPLRQANQSHVRVHYPELVKNFEAETGKKIALSTMQRYGHDLVGARQERVSEKTTWECEFARLYASLHFSRLVGFPCVGFHVFFLLFSCMEK